MLLFSLPAKSQTNLVKNGSFEWHAPLPTDISWEGGGATSLQLTHCIGDWFGMNYPVIADRHKQRPEGCDGWYDPSNGVYNVSDPDYYVGSPDYFHRSVTIYPAIKIDVPDNYRNRFGDNSDNHKQEPFDDDGDGIVDSFVLNTEDAYVGIGNLRKVPQENPIDSNDNYAEYITQRLRGPDTSNYLHQGHIYHVSFRISWANNDSGWYPLTGHYLINKIDAYFDSVQYVQDGAYPLDIDNDNNQLCKMYRRDIISDYLNQHGGPYGTQWMLLEGDIIAPVNLYYMTIGNFKLNWEEDVDFAGPAVPNDSLISTYYFIDSVNVYKIADSTCDCNSGFDKILFEADSNDCCYNLKIYNDQDCYVPVDKITLLLTRMNADGSITTITDNSFFSGLINYETGWSQNTPFVVGTNYIIKKNYSHFIAPGETLNVAKICFPNDGNVYRLQFSIESENDGCKSNDFFVQCLPVPDSCCESINAYIEVAPTYEDGSVCCYKLHIDLPDSCQSGIIDNVSVVSVLENKELFKSFTPLPSGQSSYEFCVAKADFLGMSSIPIHIKFQYQGDSAYFCVKDDSLLACTSLEVPCYPPTNPGGWENPNDGEVIFVCPSTGEICYAKFRYTYRHVKDQNGNSLHRDVQIISFNFLSHCNCPDEIVKKMLEQIWNNQFVKDKFGISGITPWNVGEIKCFTNYRVITSDCWMRYEVLVGIDENGNLITKTYKKKCDGVECCYARYKVCYIKDPATQEIKYYSFDKLDENIPGPIQCDNQSYPPCAGSNCITMLPVGSSNHQFINTNVNEKNTDCNVFITNDRSNSVNYVNIACKENGQIKLRIVDLFGNLVYRDSFSKNSYLLKREININLPSGVYLLRVNINNNLLFRNKINIVR